MNNRYFTKSAYATALECPTRLFYCCDKQYANQDDSNEFLTSLADGGFQVGELAKIYYGISPETYIDIKDYEESISKTNELMTKECVNIAEAAFRYGKLFVRADIIEKKGHRINLIEVKAKSYDSSNGVVPSQKDCKKELKPYVMDVAFQKYVICNALKEQYPGETFEVHAYLMMADKAMTAPVNGMNQFFKINGNDSIERIEVLPGAEKLADERHILTPFDVNDLCDGIIAEKSFVSNIASWSEAYCSHTRISSDISHECFKCPFFETDGNLNDGYKECWKDKAGFSDEDFKRPYIRDFSMGDSFWKKADALIRNKKYFLEDITLEDLKPKSKNAKVQPRRVALLGIETGRQDVLTKISNHLVDGKLYLDTDGLAREMKEWIRNKTLHFIDFETAATALPFYEGMRPYECIAFQYSHHTVRINDDGTYNIEHASQFINTRRGYFPNFDFVRSLREELSKDEGTIFRYATHENTILRGIRKQLQESNEKDRDVLIEFIDSITQSTDKEEIKWKGKRNMVNLETVVKKYFTYPAYMKGRTSIKVALPAVLNASNFIQEKYSKPIYGTQIKSCNYSPQMPITWVKYIPGTNEVEDPYHELGQIEKEILKNSGISEEEYKSLKEEVGETVANGGAALCAYSKLQYTDMEATDALRDALLRYCELDTMAMVFIWEYFYNETR